MNRSNCATLFSEPVDDRQIINHLIFGHDGKDGILGSVSVKGLRLGEEDELSCKVRSYMIHMKMTGRYKGIFTHVPNESGQGSDFSVLRRQAKKKAMGMIPGGSDWWLIWNGGGCVIELKSSTGRLSHDQKDFKAWCDADGVRHYVARSVQQFEAALIDAGGLLPE